MNVERSAAKLWFVRVVLPVSIVIGAGLLVTWRPMSPVIEAESDVRERLHKVGLAINEATTRLGRPPENEEDLRPFLAEHGDPDRLLASPADGQLLVVRWGIDVRATDLGTVLAYEPRGANGGHLVLTASGVLFLRDEELQAAVNAR